MIPILSGNVASALPTGYEVANSCRFNDDDSAYMHFTPSSAGNRRTMTLSVWFKGTSLADGTNNILGQYNSSNENNSMLLTIESNGRIMVWNYTTSAYTMNLRTNRLLRDPSAWYHVVVAVDTTQSTDTDRVKIYVNGVQETSFFASTYPTQNLELFMNEDKAQNIGTQRFGSTVSSPFDGYMAEFCFIDGQQLAPTSFGEFDDDSPRIWKPKDFKDDVTFGSNGYYLDFEDSSALGNDISGNNNDFTTVNFAATDQSTDTCTNNFCTFNPLVPQDHTFSEGNLKYSSGSGWESGIGTIAFSAGKFYMEQKITAIVGGIVRSGIGICNATDATLVAKNEFGYQPSGAVGDSIGYNDNAVHKNDSAVGSSWGDQDNGDVVQMAVDADNGAVYFGLNGTWGNSGNPESGASKTGGITFTVGETYVTGAIGYGGSAVEQNWGNPVSALSSGNADANGYGNFEYAPPSGYYALCTKNLAEFG